MGARPRARCRPRRRRAGGGRRPLGLDEHGPWPLEPDAVHGEPPGQEGQEAVLEDDPVEGEVVAPARVSSRGPDVAEGQSAKDREPELGGLEADAASRGRPIEQRAAELRRGELRKRENGDAQSEDTRADGETTAFQRVSAACSIARA
jgi:hypothetical protein